VIERIYKCAFVGLWYKYKTSHNHSENTWATHRKSTK